MPEITVSGLRLFDETGCPFLVLLAPRTGELNQRQSATFLEWCVSSRVVLATAQGNGQYLFDGPDSLTAIAQARIDANTQWPILTLDSPNQPDQPHTI